MLEHLRDYAKALYRHWVKLLTGTVLAAVVTWAPLLAERETPAAVAWLLFGGVIVSGGFLAWRDERVKSEGREASKVAILNQLTDYRQDGANLYAEKLTLAGKVPLWQGRVNAWRDKVSQYLEARVSRAARGQFEILGAFNAADVIGSVDAAHSRGRLLLSEHLKRLEHIIEQLS